MFSLIFLAFQFFRKSWIFKIIYSDLKQIISNIQYTTTWFVEIFLVDWIGDKIIAGRIQFRYQVGMCSKKKYQVGIQTL